MSSPDFERPPVNEVSLGVQVEPIDGLHAAHLGLFWGRVRRDFPALEEHPPLAPTPIEDVSSGPRLLDLQVQMLTVPPVPRLLFIDGSGTELLQVQSDRFIANWRRLAGADVYPRYPD